MRTWGPLADFLSTREEKIGKRHQAQLARRQGDPRRQVETVHLIEATLIPRAGVVVVVVVGSDLEVRRRRSGQNGRARGEEDGKRALRPLAGQVDQLLVCESRAAGPVAGPNARMQENMDRPLAP